MILNLFRIERVYVLVSFVSLCQKTHKQQFNFKLFWLIVSVHGPLAKQHMMMEHVVEKACSPRSGQEAKRRAQGPSVTVPSDFPSSK